MTDITDVKRRESRVLKGVPGRTRFFKAWVGLTLASPSILGSLAVILFPDHMRFRPEEYIITKIIVASVTTSALALIFLFFLVLCFIVINGLSPKTADKWIASMSKPSPVLKSFHREVMEALKNSTDRNRCLALKVLEIPGAIHALSFMDKRTNLDFLAWARGDNGDIPIKASEVFAKEAKTSLMNRIKEIFYKDEDGIDFLGHRLKAIFTQWKSIDDKTMVSFEQLAMGMALLSLTSSWARGVRDDEEFLFTLSALESAFNGLSGAARVSFEEKKPVMTRAEIEMARTALMD